MKGLEERKARIDTDVMERFVPSCSRCVNADKCTYWLRNFVGMYFGIKPECEHYKRKV